MNLDKESNSKETGLDGPGFRVLVNTLLRRRLRTPDYPALSGYERHKVFVYGTLMEGLGNHALLKPSRFLGEVVTIKKDFDMISLGMFPGVLRCPSTTGNYIWGELYDVSLSQLMACDRLESNGSLYKRELIRVETTKEQEAHTAWIYLLVQRGLNDYKDSDSVDSWDDAQSWWGHPKSWG